ncbi:MAG: ammonium transporter, partial [Alphaproteobacteria bacterium]|nr:ammonium transporter [Alphaproteobacteria bacterium]
TMAVPITNPDASFVTQAIGVVSIGAFVIVASSIAWLVLKATVGIRLDDEAEALGADRTELGLEAYPEFGQGSQSL